MNIPFIDGEQICQWCGQRFCETMRCIVCGHDLNVCKDDPTADPDCPNCGYKETIE